MMIKQLWPECFHIVYPITNEDINAVSIYGMESPDYM